MFLREMRGDCGARAFTVAFLPDDEIFLG